jgi:hypothetical protein
MADAPEVIPEPIEGAQRTPDYKPHGQKYESEFKSAQPALRMLASESTLEVYSSTAPNTTRSWGHGESESGGTQTLGSPGGLPIYEEERYGHIEERQTEDWQIGFWQCCTPGGLCRLKLCTCTNSDDLLTGYDRLRSVDLSLHTCGQDTFKAARTRRRASPKH